MDPIHVYAKTLTDSGELYALHFTMSTKQITFVDEISNRPLRAYDLVYLVDLATEKAHISIKEPFRMAKFFSAADVIGDWHPALKIVDAYGKLRKQYILDKTVDGSWLNNSYIKTMVRYFREMPEEDIRRKAYDENSDRRYQIFNHEKALNWELWFQE